MRVGIVADYPRGPTIGEHASDRHARIMAGRGDVIALGALFVTLVISSLTLILNYRQRTADYRLRVYGEQVIAHSEVASALARHYLIAQASLH